MIPDPNDFDQLGKLQALTQPVYYRNFGWARRPLGNAGLARWFSAVDRSIYNAKQMNQKVTPLRGQAQLTEGTPEQQVRRAKRWARTHGAAVAAKGGSPEDMLRAAPAHIRVVLKTMMRLSQQKTRQQDIPTPA